MSETHAKSQLGGQLVFQLWTYLEDLRLNNPHPRAMKSLVSPDPGFLFEHHQSSPVVAPG